MMTLFDVLRGVREAGLGGELPRALTPAVVGLTVGIFVFVVGLIAVLLLVDRGNGPPRRLDVSPLRPTAIQPSIAPVDERSSKNAAPGALSASGLARTEGCTILGEDHGVFSVARRPQPPVSVTAILMVEAPPVAGVGPPSEPHPLSIIPRQSSAMKLPVLAGASFADLELDDGATQIGETYFDEPPQPGRRTDAPRIRPIAPSAPRFPGHRHLP